MRAYYRETKGDMLQPQDSGRPVSEEQLRAFGLRLWSLEGKSEDELLASFRQLARDLGIEGQSHLFDYRKQTCGMPGNPEATTKEVKESFLTPTLFACDILCGYVAGTKYFDFKDPGKQEWIRLDIKAPQVVLVPAGTLCEIRSPDVAAVECLFKTTDPLDSVLLKSENLDDHPVRATYLSESVGA
ncbi:1,2-dihydroxy-3-keto-5-methylthiopentene dioxygenase [Marasmius crinis-equi]|uniref:1,2-dihydroxy-3-keto-5-methylthiopentene dioxygenase n=1 Tax=Marasmius crinis-equi TaxID=585013 RepID=A0ABR3FH33_9AGAR